MLLDLVLSKRLKGLIFCTPKNASTRTPENYSPIAMLKRDYKILARLISARVWPIIAKLFHHSQYRGVPGNTKIDAFSTVRDVISKTQTTRLPFCVVSLDFKQAFVRISHTYLVTVLGFGAVFIECVRMIYGNSTSTIQVIERMCSHPHPMWIATVMPLARYYLSLSQPRVILSGWTSKGTLRTWDAMEDSGGRVSRWSLRLSNIELGISIRPRRNNLLREGNWSNPECCEV